MPPAGSPRQGTERKANIAWTRAETRATGYYQPKPGSTAGKRRPGRVVSDRFIAPLEECRIGKTQLRIPKAAEGTREEAEEGREIEAPPGTPRRAGRWRSARHAFHGRH